jgi:hypothetical protein
VHDPTNITLMLLHSWAHQPQFTNPLAIIDITDSDSELAEPRPSKRRRVRFSIDSEENDKSWLKGEIGSMRDDVSHMRDKIISLEKSIGRLCECLVILTR